MISLHKLHFHVHYEEVHQYKRFPKFSIKTLTSIGCPNFKNEQKTGQSNLGVMNVRLYEIIWWRDTFHDVSFEGGSGLKLRSQEVIERSRSRFSRRVRTQGTEKRKRVGPFRRRLIRAWPSRGGANFIPSPTGAHWSAHLRGTATLSPSHTRRQVTVHSNHDLAWNPQPRPGFSEAPSYRTKFKPLKVAALEGALALRSGSRYCSGHFAGDQCPVKWPVLRIEDALRPVNSRYPLKWGRADNDNTTEHLHFSPAAPANLGGGEWWLGQSRHAFCLPIMKRRHADLNQGTVMDGEFLEWSNSYLSCVKLFGNSIPYLDDGWYSYDTQVISSSSTEKSVIPPFRSADFTLA